VAVASPVYFIPAGFLRPAPGIATVRLHVTDDEGHPVAAKVSVTDFGKEIFNTSTDNNGDAKLTAPPTASIAVKAPGFGEVRKDLYMDSPVFGFCKDFNDFYTPAGFMRLRELIGNLGFEIKLKKI
jgi:hypothetical protein